MTAALIQVNAEDPFFGQEIPIKACRRLCGRSASEVYRHLVETSMIDPNMPRIYNTSNWTVKGIAGEIDMARNTVQRAIDKLLDEGFIGIAGQKKNPAGSNSIIWSIYRPDWIPNVRYSIELMGPPSARLHDLRKKMKRVQIAASLVTSDF